MDLKVGDRVDLDGGRIVVLVEHKSGPNVRLAFEADRDVAIRKLSQANTVGQHATRKLAPVG